MLPNRISAELSDADRDEVLAAIETIKKKLPFLVTLSKKEAKSLPKAGAKTRDFSVKTLEVATQNPDIMPRNFNLEEMRKDVELYQAFESIYLAMLQLMEGISSTYMLIRSETYSGGLMIYTQSKLQGKELGLEAANDMLAQLFARKFKTDSDPTDDK